MCRCRKKEGRDRPVIGQNCGLHLRNCWCRDAPLRALVAAVETLLDASDLSSHKNKHVHDDVTTALIATHDIDYM